MNILEQIVADKREEIAERKRCEKRETGIQTLEEIAAESPFLGTPKPFLEALSTKDVSIIAEVKRRSPSAGEIRKPFDPAELARVYERSGASAISCLLDKKYFGGGESDFRIVRKTTKLPMLYKEFVVDEWQLGRARKLGASAVLLIAAVLNDFELKRFVKICRFLELQPLVEVHSSSELKRALELGADCLGVNNRDLKTFRTDIATTEELAELVPADCTLISESGIRTPADIVRLQNAGAKAVLVGETLLRNPDPGRALRKLSSATSA